MRHPRFVVIALAALSACGMSAPSALYVRPGLTVQQLGADTVLCTAEAREAERARPDGTVAPAPGAARDMADVQRGIAAHQACFLRLGYRTRRLTEAEQEEWLRLRTFEERSAFSVRLSVLETQ